LVRQPLITATLSALNGFNKSLAARRGLLLATSPAEVESLKQDGEAARTLVKESLTTLAELKKSMKAEANVKRVDATLAEMPILIQLAEQMQQYSWLDDPEAKKKVTEILTVYVSHQREAEKQLTDLLKAVREMGQIEDSSALSAGESTQRVTELGILAVVLLAGAIAFLIARAITRPLKAVVERANAIAEGELTGTELQATTADETAELTGAINRMQANLKELIGAIGRNAEAVASASEEMSSAATQSAEGATTQTDQAHQVATAMQEMASTVLQVSENSNKAAEGARNAVKTAKEGGAIVDAALTSMRSIAGSVQTTAEKIQELGKSSDQIGKIIGVIDEIADQTNLLALNAAIEAARAGEQGRGFAVVADEVRKLAERTTKATREIAQMIETVQTGTRHAVENMQAGTRTVEEGVETTAKAGQSLQEIIHAADQVGDMVTQIATTATEQSSTTDEVNRNVEQIARLTRESAAAAQQSAKACQDLSNLALDLQQLVNRFHLEENHAETRAAGRGRGVHPSRFASTVPDAGEIPPAIFRHESGAQLPLR
jgi:methyl-accepting chemotaxis protein